MEADLFTARIDDTADITERTQNANIWAFSPLNKRRLPH